jgi:hypothetical protein
MYVGRDFDPCDPGESEVYTFDFIKDIQKGDAVVSAVWTCEVAEISEGNDDAAAAMIDGLPTVSGTKTSQRVTGPKAGVVYALQAMATTRNGDHVSLWGHLPCMEPG